MNDNHRSVYSSLWYRLRGSRINGWKFRRQYGIGVYILDFYCPLIRLGIELDGNSHYSEDGRAHDTEREAALKLHHIKTLRFTIQEVMTNIEGVLSAISSYRPQSLLSLEGGLIHVVRIKTFIIF